MSFFSQCRTAVMTASAFVLGTIVFPALHLTFHALPHDHAGSETHYHAAPAEEHHQHAEGADHHHEHDAEEERHQPFDPQHGSGSSAHFALAISDDAAASFVLPFHALGLEARMALPSSVLIATAHVSVQRFRGPPRG